MPKSLLIALWLAGCVADEPPPEPASNRPVMPLSLADDTLEPSGPFLPIEAQRAHHPDSSAHRDTKVRPAQPSVRVAPPPADPRRIARQSEYLAAWNAQRDAHPEWSEAEHEQARAKLKSTLLEVTP